VTFGEARNGEELMEAFASRNGTSLSLTLHAWQERARCLEGDIDHCAPGSQFWCLSMHPEDQFAVRVLKAGAAGT